MAGREKLDTFETSSRTGHGRKSENMIDPPRIRPRRNHGRCEQAFNFGCEKKPVPLPRPEKRRDAETIASELELASSLVPQCDGELPSQSLPHFLAIIFPQMGDDLSVAVCDELVSARPELLSSLDVIKQFAVENYGDAAVFVEDRLLPIG